MGEIFRILDRFNVTGRGRVYLIKNPSEANIRVGDMMHDLLNNGFKVTAIDMGRSLSGDMESGENLVGLSIECLNGVDAKGNLLIRDFTTVNFIFCNHPLHQQEVDEDYREEYLAASKNHTCALFSYEDLEMGRLSLYGSEIEGMTIYRGWMMRPDLYRSFYDKLMSKGIVLINMPEEYEKYHLLPGWYEDFKDETSVTVWEEQGTLESAMALSKGLAGTYIVKDFVKSRKHEWLEACFIEDIENVANAARVIETFIDRQGSALVGGVVLRKYEQLRFMGYHEKSGMPISEEYRVFIYAGRILIMDDYWRTSEAPHLSDEELLWLEENIKKVKSNFVTIDIARCEDGRLIIMELGDGQVSGLQQINAEAFYSAFNTLENER